MKGLGFGKPKPEKQVVDNRDYGYTPEKEFNQLRHKSPAATISKAGARPDNFTNQGQALGPGQYQTQKEFGAEAKGLGFGKPRPDKKVIDNRDYNYSPEREFVQTRHKSPSAVISKARARPESFGVQGDSVGPGQYQAHKEFG